MTDEFAKYRDTGHCLEHQCLQSIICECDCQACVEKRDKFETLLAVAKKALLPDEDRDFGDVDGLFSRLVESLSSLARVLGPLQRQRDDLQSRMSEMVLERQAWIAQRETLVIERQAWIAQRENLDRVVKAADRVGVYRRTGEDFKCMFEPLDELQAALDWTRR